jgi:hypothetical protein
MHVLWLGSDGQRVEQALTMPCKSAASVAPNEIIVELSIWIVTELEHVKYVLFDPQMTPKIPCIHSVVLAIVVETTQCGQQESLNHAALQHVTSSYELLLLADKE